MDARDFLAGCTAGKSAEGGLHYLQQESERADRCHGVCVEFSKKCSELANVARALCLANIASCTATLKWLEMLRSSKQRSLGRRLSIRTGAWRVFVSRDEDVQPGERLKAINSDGEC